MNKIEQLNTCIGKVGFFFNSEDEKTHKMCRYNEIGISMLNILDAMDRYAEQLQPEWVMVEDQFPQPVKDMDGDYIINVLVTRKLNIWNYKIIGTTEQEALLYFQEDCKSEVYGFDYWQYLPRCPEYLY